MKYEVNVNGRIAIPRSGIELDSYVQEALSWGTKPSDIRITLVEEQNNEPV